MLYWHRVAATLHWKRPSLGAQSQRLLLEPRWRPQQSQTLLGDSPSNRWGPPLWTESSSRSSRKVRDQRSDLNNSAWTWPDYLNRVQTERLFYFVPHAATKAWACSAFSSQGHQALLIIIRGSLSICTTERGMDLILPKSLELKMMEFSTQWTQATDVNTWAPVWGAFPQCMLLYFRIKFLLYCSQRIGSIHLKTSK
jgi:hypothetical protein